MLPDVIRTERLALRPWSFDDTGDVFLYANDVEWSRYLRISQPYSLEDARQFIAAQVLLNRRAHHSWAIEYGARVVGGINLRLLSDLRIGMLGYAIARAVWGRGLETDDWPEDRTRLPESVGPRCARRSWHRSTIR